jgi:hypothetical protein
MAIAYPRSNSALIERIKTLRANRHEIPKGTEGSNVDGFLTPVIPNQSRLVGMAVRDLLFSCFFTDNDSCESRKKIA